VFFVQRFPTVYSGFQRRTESDKLNRISGLQTFSEAGFWGGFKKSLDRFLILVEAGEKDRRDPVIR
jgi:hypothetical protein